MTQNLLNAVKKEEGFATVFSYNLLIVMKVF